MATLSKITKFFLFFLHLLIFTSNPFLAKQKNPKNRLILSLTHSSTSLPHPKHSSTNLRLTKPTQLDQAMVEPVREVRDGYLISLNIGTPPQIIQVYMDTGSDLTWVPCGNVSFDCLNCDEYKNSKLSPAFSPSSSSTSYRDSCSSPFCVEIHSSDNPFDACTVSGCSLSTIVKGNCPRPCPSFAYTYGGFGVVIGTLNRDSIRVHESTGFRDISKFVFGCVGSTYHEPIGIAGFGRGKLSFPSQLGFVKKGFSHCFLPFKYSNNPNFSSPLIIGDVSFSSKDENFMQFTPMLKSHIYPNYYYIGLESITLISDDYNNNNLSVITTQVQSNLREFDSFGNGGMLIDSGTTYTHLPEPLYSELLSSLKSCIDYPRAFDVETRSGFDLCYKVPCKNSSKGLELPSIKFLFLNNVSVVLPQENHFYVMSAPSNSSVVKCLLFQSMEDGDFGPAGVFGSFQQQNLKVVYDLENERIGFQAMDCALDASS
ncbi:Eukaryotic aspartyl protease family protein [Euphorbia peplus]|nr:Eukaryotic aspartyl protease family protein [Euphorbia peplus]